MQYLDVCFCVENVCTRINYTIIWLRGNLTARYLGHWVEV